MRNKEIRFLVFVLVAAMTVSGCAQIRDKFVRKPKEEPTAKRYQVVRAYDVHPSMELYTKRYIYWKNWHRELLEVLTNSNQKKRVVAIEQDISNLMDMRDMLVDEKGDQLQVIIDEMIVLENTIKHERITAGNETRVRRKLEMLGREIKKDFSYTKIRGDIRRDFRTEPVPGSEPATAQEQGPAAGS